MGQAGDLRLELLLPGRRTRAARSQRRLARLKEVSLPAADGLLADLLPPSRLGDRHLPSQHAQHDPNLPPGQITGGLPMVQILLQGLT